MNIYTERCPPVLLLVFNRPDLTRRVFAEIRKTRPQRLFVAADGPRAASEDHASCAATRKILEGVDWDCDVMRLYQTDNLGCKRAVSAGITWFFSHVEAGVILEDDCLPDPSFFSFCAELLARYAHDGRVAAISGDNFQRSDRSRNSYYYSAYPHVWGWASWRRAWTYFDPEMTAWPAVRNTNWLRRWLRDPAATRYWTRIFDRAHSGEIDTWDYQWTFSCWLNGALAILPGRNLVSNIGFGSGATHSTNEISPWANLATHSMTFPLTHPERLARNAKADRYTSDVLFQTGGGRKLPFRRALDKVRSFVGRGAVMCE